MRTSFVSALIPLAMASFALTGCLDRELVPLDASPDAIASDSSPDGASACGAACDAEHCIDGTCVECTIATEAADCTSPELPACVANVCASCRGSADCDRFSDTAACATSGELEGECVACDVDADCTDLAAARCDSTTKSCIACEDSTQCGRFEDTPVCVTEGARAGTCVACAADTDCTDPTAARCDLATHTCAPCTDSDQCVGTGENVCDDGACVECTEASASAHCGGNACDPVARTCTTTPRDSLGSCQPCLSDDECFGDAACVPMRFEGVEVGHYCLTRRPDAGCLTNDPPYRVGLTDRVSRSRAPSATYCGVNEDLTTCEAVLVAMAGTACVDSEECPEGGVCAFVSSGDEQCTYPCSQGAECPITGGLSLCTNLPGDDYCGRR